MFKLLRRFASKAAPEPREAALRALAVRDYARAERGFAELLAQPGLVSGERAFLLNKRGVALVGLGEREGAQEAFAQALRAAPTFAPALTNVGNLALERGEVDAAIASFAAAIASDDGYALAHLNIAVAYRQQGRIGEAVRSLRKAQRLEGRSTWRLSKGR